MLLDTVDFFDARCRMNERRMDEFLRSMPEKRQIYEQKRDEIDLEITRCRKTILEKKEEQRQGKGISGGGFEYRSPLAHIGEGHSESIFTDQVLNTVIKRLYSEEELNYGHEKRRLIHLIEEDEMYHYELLLLDKMEIEIEYLPEEYRKLIENHFFKGKDEITCMEELCIARATFYDRKRRILRELSEIYNNYGELLSMKAGRVGMRIRKMGFSFYDLEW